MNIRAGTPEDAADIERIARASFDRVYAFFAIGGARRAWLLLLADEDGIAAGFLEGRLFEGRPPVGYIYFVATDPARRRRGIARALVETCLAAFEDRGATRVFAAVPMGNDASMALFTNLGFREAPRRALWRWYGWRGLSVWMRMLIAPHEVLLAREGQ